MARKLYLCTQHNIFCYQSEIIRVLTVLNVDCMRGLSMERLTLLTSIGYHGKKNFKVQTNKLLALTSSLDVTRIVI